MNYTKACGDGEIYDMKKSDEFIFSSVSIKTETLPYRLTLTKPNGLFTAEINSAGWTARNVLLRRRE